MSDFPLVSREERFSDPESLSKIIETVAINSYVYNQAKRLNLDKNDDFQQRLLFQKHNILYKTAFSRKITGTISINDDTLRKFYAVHRDSLYMTKQRYEVQEIYITDKFWPEFRRKELYEALFDYFKRECVYIVTVLLCLMAIIGCVFAEYLSVSTARPERVISKKILLDKDMFLFHILLL